MNDRKRSILDADRQRIRLGSADRKFFDLYRKEIADTMQKQSASRNVAGAKQVVRQRELAVARLTENTYRAGAAVPPHSHDYNEACFLLRGSYSAGWENQEVACEPGAIVFHPANVPHWDSIKDSDCRSLKIQWYTMDRIEHFSPPTSAASVTAPFLQLLARRIYSEFVNDDSCSSMALEGLLLVFLAEFQRELARRDSRPWLQQVASLIEARFQERLTLAALAGAAGVSQAHLSACFRERYGLSVGEFIKQQRIQYAIQAISNTERSLSDIALSAGFSDQSHLSRELKKVFGASPSALRKRRIRG